MKKEYITPKVTRCGGALRTSMLEAITSYDFDSSDGGSNEHDQYTDSDDSGLEIGTHKRGSSDDDSWGNIW